MIGGRAGLVVAAALAGAAGMAHGGDGVSVHDRRMRYAGSMSGFGGTDGAGGVHGPAGTNRGYQRRVPKMQSRSQNRRAHRG